MGSRTATAAAIAATAAIASCGDADSGAGGAKAWPPCEYTELELDQAVLDDDQENTVGWPGFMRGQLDGLERGAEAELTWYGYRSTDVLTASPDSGTTTIRISGRLRPGPITYEQTPSNSIELECVPYAGVAHLPIELRVTTDDGALDEVWLAEGRAQPSWTPEENESPPPPGSLSVSPVDFPPEEFSGSLTVDLASGAMDGWEEWSWSFGSTLFFNFGPDEPASMGGGMSFRRFRREGGDGVLQLAVVAEWASPLREVETDTDVE